jgi:chromosomal replication initiator protein
VNNSSTDLDLPRLWESICVELQQFVSADSVRRWFQPLEVGNFDDGVLSLIAKNSIFKYWIEDNYMPQLTSVVARVVGSPIQVRITCEGAVAEELPSADAGAVSSLLPDASGADAAPLIRSKPANNEKTGLNPRNSFECFVVGTNNQFAHAAAAAAAEAPARTYNPLFLHGKVGLGKTHLMQAVGHQILRRKPHLRVLYVTSEQFTNEFIGAIQHGELARFRKHYRQVDVLLIDDVQFLAGKDRSQEEFFHTFNSLFDGSKQIVLTADSPPNEIANLEKRLTSRFEWGLTAELQPPDLETRVAILRHKLQGMQEELSDEVLRFIAENVKSNVRRLEGALTRVAAFATLHGRRISVAEVSVLLKDILQQESSRAVSIDAIQRKVAETYDIRLADMTSKRRPANIALPRMVAMYLSRRLTASSLSEIGDAFGGRDHGTVLHAHRTIEKKMDGDEKLRQVVLYLADKLGHPCD